MGASQGRRPFAAVYQSQNVKRHLAGTTPVAAGTIDTNSLMADFSYGFTDKWAVDVALPYVMSKYRGPRLIPAPTSTTAATAGRFPTFDSRCATTSRATTECSRRTSGSAMPSHDYAYYGHAAPGQRLRELQLGVFAAKLFEAGVPGMFVWADTGYGFVEKVQDISHNRSSADFEMGYFFTPAFRAFAMVTGCTRTATASTFRRLGACGRCRCRISLFTIRSRRSTRCTPAGAWPTRSATRWTSSRRSRSLVVGRNGHALNRGITVGTSWSFARKNKTSVVASRTPASPDSVTARKEGSLIRCICQKSGA